MNTKLNNLVTEYKRSKCEMVFSDIYEEVANIRRRSIRSSRTMGLDELDVSAAFDDTLLDCIDKSDKLDENNFEHFLNYSLKNRITDLRRKKGTRQKYETHVFNSEGESDAATLDSLLLKQERIDEGNHEEDLVRTDQRQLIGYLTRNLKDPVTTAIVNEVLNDRTIGKFQPTAIAKKLNVHHYTVTRKLSQLKKNYDSAVLGDHRDYLCG